MYWAPSRTFNSGGALKPTFSGAAIEGLADFELRIDPAKFFEMRQRLGGHVALARAVGVGLVHLVGHAACRLDRIDARWGALLSGLGPRATPGFVKKCRGVVRVGLTAVIDGESWSIEIPLQLGSNEVCVIYEDQAGDIWFSSEGYGVYRYNGKFFTNYSEAQGLGVPAVQTIFEDREGRFWVGGGGGLYRFDGKSFINVTKDGPWN